MTNCLQIKSGKSSGWGGSLIAGIDDFLIEEGGRLGEVYGYKLDGFYTTEDFTWDNGWKLKEGRVNPTESGMKVNNFGPGSPKLKANADGKIEKERLGNTIPKITGGFGINARYKSFDLSAFFNYSIGKQNYQRIPNLLPDSIVKHKKRLESEQ